METGGGQIAEKRVTLAKAYFQLAAEAMPDRSDPLRTLAIAEAMDNNRKAALECLRQAKIKSTDMPQFQEWLQSEPAFANFHDDPAFQALLAN